VARISVAILLFTVTLVMAANARAHAVLLETLPAAGSAVAQSPAAVILRFNEPVAPVSVRLLDSSGSEVAVAGKAHTTDNELTLPLTGLLDHGQYLLSYRVTSLDSHLIKGSFTFAVGSGPPSPVLSDISEAPAQPWVERLTHLNRALYFIALLAAAGLALFRVLFALPQTLLAAIGKTLTTAAAAGIVTALLNIGLSGVVLTGGGFEQLLADASWTAAGGTSLATSMSVAIPGLLILLLAGRLSAASGTSVALVAGATLSVASLGFSGHATSTQPVWLMTPVLIAHAMMAALWFGSLWALYRLARSHSVSAAAGLLQAFSTRATGMITVLLTSAAILVWLQLEQIGDFLQTGYGLLLSVKITLVALLLLLAAANRWWLTPALAAGSDRTRRLLRISIGSEVLLAVLVIGVTAVLGATPPPRAAEHLERTKDSGSRQTVIVSGELELTVTVTPARTGGNQLDISFKQADATLADPQEVSVIWSLPAAGIEPLEQQATRISAGVFHLHQVDLIIAGDWTLRVEALIDDFTKTAFETRIMIDN
jgi:copper transport protein